MRARFPKLSRESALIELTSFVEELDARWERDGLAWAPTLLKILREFVTEASKQAPDIRHLKELHGEAHAYFRECKFLKGVCFVLGWIDMACGIQAYTPPKAPMSDTKLCIVLVAVGLPITAAGVFLNFWPLFVLSIFLVPMGFLLRARKTNGR